MDDLLVLLIKYQSSNKKLIKLNSNKEGSGEQKNVLKTMGVCVCAK